MKGDEMTERETAAVNSALDEEIDRHHYRLSVPGLCLLLQLIMARPENLSRAEGLRLMLLTRCHERGLFAEDLAPYMAQLPALDHERAGARAARPRDHFLVRRCDRG